MNSAAPLRVLLVETSADNRLGLRWLLMQTLPDFEFQEAAEIESAMQFCAMAPPDLIVLSASVPRIEILLTAVTEQTRELRVPVILLTDAAFRSERLSAEEAGITEIIQRDELSAGLLRRVVLNALESSSMRLALNEQGRELDRLRGELALQNHNVQQLEQARQQLAQENADLIRSLEALQATPPPLPLSAVSPVPATPHSSPAAVSPPPLPAAARNRMLRPALISTGAALPDVEDDELAARVQRDLLPKGSPLIEGIDIAGLSLPASATGGDYYDYLPMADDILTISIGECSGRGIAPAMLMASVRAYLRVLSGVTSDVSDILSRTNQLTTEDVADEEFLITLMLVQYDQLAKSIRYASAGLQAHLIDREGEAHVLPSTGMPIGLRTETIIPEGDIRRIRAGDILLLTTDGMAKMTSPAGEAFGSKRILELVRQHRGLPSRMIVSYLHKAAMEFTHQSSRSDDITMVVIKVEH